MAVFTFRSLASFFLKQPGHQYQMQALGIRPLAAPDSLAVMQKHLRACQARKLFRKEPKLRKRCPLSADLGYPLLPRVHRTLLASPRGGRGFGGGSAAREESGAESKKGECDKFGL
jgi:hypothetical protein